MEHVETNIKTICFQSPRWMQIEIQGFMYGLLSWSLTCLEDKEEPIHTKITVEELLEHADEEFHGWPTSWLEPMVEDFIALHLSYDVQQTLLVNLERVFQDSVPTDINIFTILANGDILTTEQWERIYESIAFRNPIEPIKKSQKTRRLQGRRAVTPIKKRKSFTRHKILIVKSN